MSTLNDIKTILNTLLGGRDDAPTSALETFAINLAIQVVAFLYAEEEFRTTANVTISANTSEQALSTALRVNDIIKLYNTTSNCRMGYIPVELVDLVPSGNITKYYSRDGNNLVVRPTPANEIIVKMRYSYFPARITSSSDTVPMANYEDLIVAVATAIMWAAYEEVESSDLWLKVVNTAGVPYDKQGALRKIIENQFDLKELTMRSVS